MYIVTLKSTLSTTNKTFVFVNQKSKYHSPTVITAFPQVAETFIFGLRDIGSDEWAEARTISSRLQLGDQ